MPKFLTCADLENITLPPGTAFKVTSTRQPGVINVSISNEPVPDQSAPITIDMIIAAGQAIPPNSAYQLVSTVSIISSAPLGGEGLAYITYNRPNPPWFGDVTAQLRDGSTINNALGQASPILYTTTGFAVGDVLCRLSISTQYLAGSQPPGVTMSAEGNVEIYLIGAST